MATIEKIVITVKHQGKITQEVLANVDSDEVKALIDAIVEE